MLQDNSVLLLWLWRNGSEEEIVVEKGFRIGGALKKNENEEDMMASFRLQSG